jgi:hypothetical protein
MGNTDRYLFCAGLFLKLPYGAMHLAPGTTIYSTHIKMANRAVQQYFQ